MRLELSDLPPNIRKQVIRKIAEEDARRKGTEVSQESSETKKEKASKYHSQKVTSKLADGTEYTFDSQKEYRRYNELILLQQAGEIKNLEIQKPFELVPSQKLSNGKTERAVKYFADFVYEKPDGTMVVEDTKSPATRTDVYIIKRKLMLYRYGIEIKEV